MFLEQRSAIGATTLKRIPDGIPGIIVTLREMARLTNTAKKSPQVRELALSLTRDLPPKNWTAEVRALHGFVRDRIRYVQDINGVETVAIPEVTLRLGQGDCDDKSVLLASLLESIGHPARFVAVGFRPGELEHVYVDTKIRDQWIPLETTEPVEAGFLPWMRDGVKKPVERRVIYV